MLGITTPDAIALGSMLAALLAAYAGLLRGDKARKDLPPEPGMALIGGALVDRATLQDLTEAVRDLSATLRAAAASGRHHDSLAETLRDLVERIDGRGGRR